MSSHRRNASVGRLRDVHQLDGTLLVSYGIKFHEEMALLTNKLANEISGRELLRKLYPTSDIAFCSGNGDDRVLARARKSRAMVPVRPSPSLAKLLNLTTVGDVAEGMETRASSAVKTVVHKAHANYSALSIAFDSEGRESIELSDAYKAEEMQGSVLVQLAQELVLVANGCIECGIPYAASDYDSAWAECLQAERKDAAQAYQRLHESEKRMKSELIELLDQSALERVAVILGGRGELSIEQTLRNQPLEKLYPVILSVVSPDPAAERVWLTDYAENVAIFSVEESTDVVARA